MNSELSGHSGFSGPYLISTREAARKRLPHVECQALAAPNGGMTHRVCVAMPVSYAKQKRRSYPLVLLLDACDMLGSAIEMTRLMAQTKENRECILVCVETFPDSHSDFRRLSGLMNELILPWCRERYRVAEGPVGIFSPRPGVAAALTSSSNQRLRSLADAASIESVAEQLPAFVRGLSAFLGTGHEYGREVTPLQKPWLMKTLSALSPVISRFYPKPAADSHPNPYRCWSEKLQRHFEVFVSLPASVNGHKRFPALVVLDASIEFSIVAETAARLAARGEIEEVAVIGIGVPRSEGHLEFGYRRFEEFSPPADGYKTDDALGNIFRSLFAIRGQDARERLGMAPKFFGFITEELLPQLLQKLPLDNARLGILGHSAGGTFVGYTLQAADSPFCDYVAVSPGVGVSGHWLMREPQARKQAAAKARQVFLCIGGDEKTNLFNQIAGIPDTEAYAKQLRSNGGPNVQYHCFERETHSSVFARAVSTALSSIYARSA